ncbi:unnamed protein product, partial [Ectocarpus sp. 12 AP-2014]
MPRGLVSGSDEPRAPSGGGGTRISKGLANCSLPLPSSLAPKVLPPVEAVRWIAQGLAECQIPMPSGLAPAPGKRSPPPPVTPGRTPKKSPKKLEPREALGVWMKHAEEELAASETLVEEMQSNFSGALSYFGEDPELTPQEFFTTLHSFIKAFDEARAYVDRQAKKKEQERKLEEKKAAAAAKKKRLAEEKRRKSAELLRAGSADSSEGAVAATAEKGGGGGAGESSPSKQDGG